MTVLRHPNNQGVTLQQWRKTAAGGETSLSGTDDFSAALAYTVGAEQVFVNGVLIERGVDYTATTGTTVTGLTALVAGDIVTVSSPSAFNVANAIPKATVTAKGDVIVGTGASTVTNLAIGADGTTLVANSSASTGVSWTGNQAAGKNAVINGGFDIAQRGTSVSVAASTGTAYTLDRWALSTASNQASTVSQQPTSDTTNLPNIRYCARVQRNSGQTGTGQMTFDTYIETANSIPYIGKTITVSFYARAGANYSGGSGGFGVQVLSGGGVDQNMATAYSGGTLVNIGNATPSTFTTTWTRYSVSVTVGSTATQLFLRAFFNPTGTAGANDYFEITGVQLELGAASTTFSRAGGTLQGELAACQRYYWRSQAGAINSGYAMGSGTSGTASVHYINLPVQMRTIPTTLDWNLLQITDYISTSANVTGMGLGDGTTQINVQLNTTVSSGSTAAKVFFLRNQSNTAGYVGVGAEL